MFIWEAERNLFEVLAKAARLKFRPILACKYVRLTNASIHSIASK